MNWEKLMKSFGYAIQGIIDLLRYEQNARIHFVVATFVVITAYLLGVTYLEAAILFFAIALVFVVEIINSIIEKLLDVVHPQNHRLIAYIKDAMAGATLLSALIAVVIGLSIFFPYLARLVRP